jgi:drug/metabolite transporter (DMT)-like permease
MITWLTLTIVGLFCVALADISQKMSLKGESPLSSITNNFIVWNILGVISLIYFLFLGQSFPVLSPSFFIKLIPLATAYFLGGTFYYQSFKGNSVSLSAVLATVSCLITTFLGILFFNESTTLLKFIGSFIVLCAIVIVNYQKKLHFEKYNIYALLGGLFYGVAYTADKYFIISSSPDFYQIVLCFSVGMASFVFRPRQIIRELGKFEKYLIPSIASATIFFFLYQKFLFWAISIGGEVGRIDVLNNTTIFIIIFLEVIFLKERSNLKKKIIAALIAFVGATLLALAK